MDKNKTFVGAKPEGLVWKRRISELRGYQSAFYLTNENNDYIRVDFNLKEKRVRLYVEVFKEGGSPYFSIISQGRIMTEKSVLTGRSYGFSDVFAGRAKIFSTIPNKDVIKLIAGNYGIQASASKETIQKLSEREKRLEETKKRYFSELRRRERNRVYRLGNEAENYSLRSVISEIFDVITGIILSLGLFYILEYNFVAMGIFAAFYGIGIGVIDFFIREINPNLIKILFFLAAGTASYIYGYYII